MTKNLTRCFLVPSGVVMAAMVFFAFTAISRADVIVNNLAATPTAPEGVTGDPFGTVFTMSGTSGVLSQLTLQLVDYNGTSQNGTVFLYSAAGGIPTGSGTTIGTFSYTFGTVTPGNVSVSLTSSPLLAASTQYAIVLTSSGAPEWSSTTSSANSGAGSPGNLYYDNSGSWTKLGTGVGQMNLVTTAVPEVPLTGLLMGLGTLAIAGGQALRRKLS